MTSHLILIVDDLFDIASRLKSVKSSYVVYYNIQQRRYEVHDGDRLAFVVPYSTLDCRTIDYARETSIQRADEIFAEVERSNDKATQQLLRSIV